MREEDEEETGMKIICGQLDVRKLEVDSIWNLTKFWEHERREIPE